MDNSQFIALSPIERYALFLFAFLPFGYSAGTLNNAFFQKHVRKASKYAVENLLKRLAARKILTSPTWSSDPYSLRATLTPEQLSDLAASADRGSWWPSRDEIESSEKGAYDQYIVSENLVDIDCSFVELFRAFAVGGHGDDSKVLGRTMRGTYEGMLSRAVAARASNLLGERFEPALTVESWSSFAIRQLLPH